jgi:DNA repair protein RecO
MPLTRYRAYVLGRFPLTESSWIVSLFTREEGKVRAGARGGRQMKSPFRGALEPLNLVRVEVFAKEGQELGALRLADLEAGALDLFSDWGRSAVLFGAAEVLERGLGEHNPEEETWRLVGALLEGLRAGVAPPLAWAWFLFWFLRLHGSLVIPKSCGVCGASLGEGPLSGAVYASAAERWTCAACARGIAGEKAVLPAGGVDLLRDFQKRSLEEFSGSASAGPSPALKALSDVVYLAAVGYLGHPLKSAPSIEGLYREDEERHP